MGFSIEFCCLACTCGCADRGHMLSNSGEKFAAGNAFVSGEWRSSRWCTVEVSSHRLGSKSVMSVREKCDEKGWEERSGSRERGIPPFGKSAREVPSTQVSVQRADANLGHLGLGSSPPSLGLFERTKST